MISPGKMAESGIKESKDRSGSTLTGFPTVVPAILVTPALLTRCPHILLELPEIRAHNEAIFGFKLIIYCRRNIANKDEVV